MPDHARNRATGSLVTGLTGMTRYAWPVSCANRTEQTPTKYQNLQTQTGDVLTTYDWVSADYWKRKKRGEYIINSFFQRRLTMENPGFSSFQWTSVANYCTSPAAKQWFRYDGQFFANWFCSITTPPPSVADIVDNLAIQNLRTEVWTACMKDRQKGEANFVESLAEMHQAYELFANPLDNVRKLVRHFRTSAKRAKGFEKVLADSNAFIRFASSEWLRFRYGITPFVSDVKAAMVVLKKKYEVKPQVYTARAKGQIGSTTKNTGSFDITGIARVSYGITGTHQVSVRAGYYDKYTSSPWTDLGLTFHNTILVWWELTRYSFVVDWFVNVGDLLYANVPRAGVQGLGGYISQREDKVTLVFPTGYTNINPGTWTLSGSISDYLSTKEVVKRRSPNPGEGTGLTINSDFRFDKFNRVTDALALMYQALHSIGFENH